MAAWCHSGHLCVLGPVPRHVGALGLHPFGMAALWALLLLLSVSVLFWGEVNILHLMSHNCYFCLFRMNFPRLCCHVQNDCTWLSVGEARGVSKLGATGSPHVTQGQILRMEKKRPGFASGWLAHEQLRKSSSSTHLCCLLMKYNIINLKGVEPWFLLNTMETRKSTISVKNTSISNSLGTRCGLGIRFGITFRIQQWLIV